MQVGFHQIHAVQGKTASKYLDYAMDELLHADDEENRSHYYSAIINTVVECGIVEDFIMKWPMPSATWRSIICTLSVIFFDRGAHPDPIMDFLMNYHDVDFQWGNHDIVWMGAATGPLGLHCEYPQDEHQLQQF